VSDQVTGNISTVFFQISKKNKNILSRISGSPTTASWLLAYGLGYGGKVSDLVVAGLQLSLRSPGNDPTEPLAVWLGALGCGIFSQAFPSQLPHTNQVAISDIQLLLKTLQSLCYVLHMLLIVLLFSLKTQQGQSQQRRLYFREDKGAVTRFELGLQSVQAEDLFSVSAEL